MINKTIDELLEKSPVKFFNNIDDINFGTIDYFISKCIINFQKHLVKFSKDMNIAYEEDISKVNKVYADKTVCDHMDVAQKEFKVYMTLINPNEFDIDMFNYYCLLKEKTRPFFKDYISKYVYIYLKKLNMLEVEEEVLENIFAAIDYDSKELKLSDVKKIVRNELLRSGYNEEIERLGEK